MIQHKIRTGIVLIMLSLLLIGLRLQFSDEQDQRETGWRITVEVTVKNAVADDILSLSPPWDTKLYHVVGQTISHPGGTIQRTRPAKQDARTIQTKINRPGLSYLRAEFELRPRQAQGGQRKREITLGEGQRARWLQYDEGVVSDSVSASAIELSDDIEDEGTRLMAVQSLYLSHFGTQKLINVDLVRRFVALNRLAGLPARSVQGVVLKASENASIIRWVEVFAGGRWVAVDLANVEQSGVPPGWIPLKKTEGEIAETGNGSASVALEVDRLPRKLSGGESTSVFRVLDLDRLPVSTRESLGFLLLLPFGALFNALCRAFGGVQTFGIFTAPLLAVSLLYADWLETVIIVTLVIVIGVLGRSMLPEQRYARFSRLTMVFTIVALIMPIAVSILEYYDAGIAGHAVLLPIVILTTLIDRVYGYIDEHGMRPAMLKLAWTFLVAAGCYLIFFQQALAVWIVSYPEAHFATMGGVVLLSAYKGKGLLEMIASRNKRAAVAEQGQA